jgi:cell division protein FtsI (penicillin-binding protein 3)
VILDSAVGLHQGGQVSAPVFQRIVQQVLEYQHVPHDVELPANRQVLLARRNVPEKNLEENSPDHLGASLDLTESTGDAPAVAMQSKPAEGQAAEASKSTMDAAQVLAATLTQRESNAATSPPAAPDPPPTNTVASAKPSSGTVVLDVEEGGIEVPSFLGKNLRGALEAAEDAGLEIDALGSGIARAQSPLPGVRVASGARVVVHFER